MPIGFPIGIYILGAGGCVLGTASHAPRILGWRVYGGFTDRSLKRIG